MNEQFDVSIVISTYNRCEMLPPALESVLAQVSDGVNYELIVVDNNSTDKTREVVESFIARGAKNLRYVFEGRQGLSHARNAGIAAARAPIIAFTDDDVRVAPDWAARIKRAFAEHPEVDFVGGKVLPRWEAEPPSWLTPDHWSPLALTNYGEEPVYSNARNPLCLFGANFSFRREVFDEIGHFASDLQRVKDGIGSTEDHELQLRLWQAGKQGLYLPELVTIADVQANRLNKSYHRRWNAGHGRFRALRRFDEIMGPEGLRTEEPEDTLKLFGVSGFIYRELMIESVRWLKDGVRRRESAALQHENRVRHLLAYINKRRELYAAERKRSSLVEVAAFGKSAVRKKFNAIFRRAAKTR